MKKFETLQELWNYSLYCPICKQSCRTINISVSPDGIFKLITFKKEDDLLKLYCTYRQRKQDKYKANYIINLLTGKFGVEVLELIDAPDAEMNADTNLDEEEKYRLRAKVSKSYFYFYINADCKECKICHVSSADIELSHDNHTVNNMGVERESVYIITANDKYHLTMLYETGKTLVNKVRIDKNNYELVDYDKTFQCPIVNFDFSDLSKVINKIKTLIIFS